MIVELLYPHCREAIDGEWDGILFCHIFQTVGSVVY